MFLVSQVCSIAQKKEKDKNKGACKRMQMFMISLSSPLGSLNYQDKTTPLQRPLSVCDHLSLSFFSVTAP